ncbi:hypothetical protein Ahy_B10g102482 [Arachis hypogaea]|uniref:Uncharacterized protein n=1 Tax=Arachis hypogaea TaxID=3818 RepID=A0A444X1T2_ARAHY|nr:hypothetical protein Ahy_B10g102482 [Arachis hypogaea]
MPNFVGDPSGVKTKGAPKGKKERGKRRCTKYNSAGHVKNKCPMRNDGDDFGDVLYDRIRSIWTVNVVGGVVKAFFAATCFKLPDSLLLKKWSKHSKKYLEERSAGGTTQDREREFLMRYGALLVAATWMVFLGAQDGPSFHDTMNEVCRWTQTLEKKSGLKRQTRDSPMPNFVGDPSVVKTKGAPKGKKERGKRRCTKYNSAGHVKNKCPVRNDGDDFGDVLYDRIRSIWTVNVVGGVVKAFFAATCFYLDERSAGGTTQDREREFLMRYGALLVVATWMVFLGAQDGLSFHDTMNEVCRWTQTLEKKSGLKRQTRDSPMPNFVGDPSVVKTKGAPKGKKERGKQRCTKYNSAGHVKNKCPVRNDGDDFGDVLYDRILSIWTVNVVGGVVKAFFAATCFKLPDSLLLKKWSKDAKKYLDERSAGGTTQDREREFLMRYGALPVAATWMVFLGAQDGPSFHDTMNEVCRWTQTLEKNLV